jgi:hypothetical protein
MFCGWRLIQSKPNLLELGSGSLEMDAITGQCVFQGKPTGKLTIAEEIRTWLQQDLATNNIPIAALTGARLEVKLSFSVVPWNEATREIFYSDGRAIRTEKMNRCVMECNSNVTTDESVYRSKLMEVQEWPLNWPQHRMKRANPFPSLSLLLPDDVVEDTDSQVASYWKHGDTCLLQISCFFRERGPQVSATQRLSEQMRAGGDWQTVRLRRTIEGCDIAAASSKDSEDTSWVHVYLVWDWLAVHATISHKGSPSTCDWAWDALFSIRPVVM